MNPLAGTWSYEECTIKNTSVKGSISFYKNRTFRAEVKMREDHPTPPLSIITGTYKIRGNEIEYRDLEFDHGQYRPRPFGKYFTIINNNLYFSQIKIQKPEKDRTKARWSYKLINNIVMELFLKENKDPLIFDHTPPPGKGIPGLFLYSVIDSLHLLPSIPILSGKWIVTHDFSAYKGNEVFEVLRKMRYTPQSNEMAINTALFILTCITGVLALLHTLPGDAIQDYCNQHNIRQELIIPLIEPRVMQKDGYYEVILYGYYNIKGALFEFRILCGGNMYEWERKMVKLGG